MSILLERLSKTYDGHPVVHDLGLEVADGELFVLLGPSGSGKSTVLRMIAGLTPVDAGRVLLHGRDVSRMPPQKRAVGFVFQNYALFRHMTVAENVEFALRVRRRSRADRARRRDELLEVVGLAGLQSRLPHQLSGGQQQRVALARALAHRPEVLLLDEPFGALDAKIRADLRRSLRRIQRELAVTTVFVTHDQDEAFELADRMGVMNFGRLLEVGPPHELYLRPRTEFVATFLGRANLLVGECAADHVRLGPVRFPLESEVHAAGPERRVQVLFRPEDVAVKQSRDALSWPCLGSATVEDSEFCGSIERIRLRLPQLAGVRSIAPAVPFGSDHVAIEATRSQHQARRYPLLPGETAWVGVRRAHVLLHPGMRFAVWCAGRPEDRDDLASIGQLARLAHARVVALHGGSAEERQVVRDALRGAASVEIVPIDPERDESVGEALLLHPADLALVPRTTHPAAVVERLFAGGEHHVLLLPDRPRPIHRVLVAVAVGEPGKHGVLFAGRLIRHFGATARLLTVLDHARSDEDAGMAERFLAAGARTMEALGVPTDTVTRVGRTVERIREAVDEIDADLLVVGARIPSDDRPASLGAVTTTLLERIRDRAVLVIRPERTEKEPAALPLLPPLRVERSPETWRESR